MKRRITEESTNEYISFSKFLDYCDKTLPKVTEDGESYVSENIQKKDKIDFIIENTIKKELRKITESNKNKKSNKKRSVLQWLKQPEVNTAEIRRHLEGEPQSQEEEDSKRSYFMKKVNQTNGKDFTDKEVNKLYAIKSELGQ